MSNNCDYCKTPFRGERCTKKYCSDNCRQMAYLTRKGYLTKGNVTSVKDDVTINSVKPNVKDIFYGNDVKYANNVNDKKRVNDGIKSSQTQEELTLDGLPVAKLMRRLEALEKTIEQQNHLVLTMWTNIKAELESSKLQVIHEIGRQLEKHNPFRQGFNGVDYCNPCTVKEFTLRPIVKDTTPPSIESKEKRSEEQKSSSKQETGLKEQEKQLTGNNKKEAGETEQETETEEVDEPYQWINPKLHIQIQRQIDKGDGGYRFRHALSHWSVEETKSILWVNVRLRCLLDNLVKLSIRSHTNYETISALANAFIALNNSEAYKSLPNDYPYTNLIAELTDLFRSIALNSLSQKQTSARIPIWMSVKRKSSIVAACHELADSTEKVRFSELNFSPVSLQPSFVNQAKNLVEQNEQGKLKRRKKWQENFKKTLKERERNQKAA